MQHIGGVAKLVDALDLGSSGAIRESSSLSAPTIEDWCNGSMSVSKTVGQGSSP